MVYKVQIDEDTNTKKGGGEYYGILIHFGEIKFFFKDIGKMGKSMVKAYLLI